MVSSLSEGFNCLFSFSACLQCLSPLGTFQQAPSSQYKDTKYSLGHSSWNCPATVIPFSSKGANNLRSISGDNAIAQWLFSSQTPCVSWQTLLWQLCPHTCSRGWWCPLGALKSLVCLCREELQQIQGTSCKCTSPWHQLKTQLSWKNNCWKHIQHFWEFQDYQLLIQSEHTCSGKNSSSLVLCTNSNHGLLLTENKPVVSPICNSHLGQMF